MRKNWIKKAGAAVLGLILTGFRTDPYRISAGRMRLRISPDGAGRG